MFVFTGFFLRRIVFLKSLPDIELFKMKSTIAQIKALTEGFAARRSKIGVSAANPGILNNLFDKTKEFTSKSVPTGLCEFKAHDSFTKFQGPDDDNWDDVENLPSSKILALGNPIVQKQAIQFIEAEDEDWDSLDLSNAVDLKNAKVSSLGDPSLLKFPVTNENVHSNADPFLSDDELADIDEKSHAQQSIVDKGMERDCMFILFIERHPVHEFDLSDKLISYFFQSKPVDPMLVDFIQSI